MRTRKECNTFQKIIHQGIEVARDLYHISGKGVKLSRMSQTHVDMHLDDELRS